MSETNTITVKSSDVVTVESEPNWRENFPGKKLIFKGSICAFGEASSDPEKAIDAAYKDLSKALNERGATVFLITAINPNSGKYHTSYLVRGNAYITKDID